MSVADELRDPWSYVVGGLAGGMAFAVGIFPPAALGIGAAVLGAKVLTGAFAGGGRRTRRRRERRLPVITRTVEAAWLDRAEKAVDQFHDIALSAREGPIAERVRTFGQQTDESIATLQRLAGQASAVRMAIARIDPRRLQYERDRLREEHEHIRDAGVRSERERSLSSVQTQLETYQRLAVTLTTLLARLESGTLGLEGLVARLAEVIALSDAGGMVGGASQVEELAIELEGLRAGLVETEGVTTRTMEGLAPLPDAAEGSVAQAGNKPRVRRRATD